MIRTPICDLLDIQHPTALGGMGSASSPAMTAAVRKYGPFIRLTRRRRIGSLRTRYAADERDEIGPLNQLPSG